LQKSVGDVWPRISSANALQKERSGSSERGPSSMGMSAGDTDGTRSGRKGESQVGLTARTAEDRRRPRVARDRHSAARASPKAVSESRGRGCHGHRILRRVPTGGRHPRSSRSVGFHETATTMVLAASPHTSDPYPPTKRRCYGQIAARGKPREARGVRGRDRGVRGSIASPPWEENAHVHARRP
jgi:hypothetical protein